MHPSVSLLSLCLALITLPATAQIGSGGLPDVYAVADPAAEVITADNLLAGERFWPYRVARTTAEGSDQGGNAVPVGLQGVLLWVEPDGRACVDFGRDGIQRIPVVQTDLLPQANRIRLGEEVKSAPNLIYSLGPRLIDVAVEPARPLDLLKFAEWKRIIALSADPDDPRLSAWAEQIAALPGAVDRLLVFFPISEKPNGTVAEIVRAWPGRWTFAFDHLSEHYAKLYVGEELSEPRVVVLTPEGRPLARFSPEADLSAQLKAVPGLLPDSQ
ncbi:MAG: hypothetical protein ABII82_09445 [Verrucomicrobiota bacterium]